MANDKRVREVARCVRTLLKERGTTLRVKDIVERIEDENLDDITALTQRVSDSIANDLIPTQAASSSKGSDRRRALATFVAENREAVASNDTVKSVFRAAYSLGRYSKEQREQLLQEFADLLEGEETSEETSEYNF